MINCNITTQVEFLCDIKNTLKHMLSEEKKASGKTNFSDTMKITKPFMTIKSKNGEYNKKKFLSVQDFYVFIDKEYLSQIEIKL